ncbi:nucleoside triphosphate pyrophosphohydrolase [Rhabdochromatium marinum]|uniref:nucleoside triphosphate pyrophosphohydrolase n=1 Tax=Rhabdochromatium marinum TaxID=48729 RepID=UPI001907F4C9|nr:nucleoside triphosphate pyrophosphohydrolase [Rhabdochromatium marinum]MBK1650249.1 nucleoside triphosphate pyrophosphohydrolase [Rhabdochromatium marinum]
MTNTDKLTSIDPRLADRRQIDALLAIVARLRDPEYGCAWDLKQTFASILPYTLEEAYEVAESIELDDMLELREELGDLLYQVAIYARMAEEQGHFDFADVIESIAEKMIRRHPHVFGDATFASEEEARASWEAIKAAERRSKGERHHISALEGVAQALPALVRAEKLQKRAAHVGFDWEALDGVIEKVREELHECEEAVANGDSFNARVHEIGDLLFSCVNLARHLNVDAEQALRAANHRFEKRFHRVEVCLRAAGLSPSAEHRERMERLWETVKSEER